MISEHDTSPSQPLIVQSATMRLPDFALGDGPECADLAPGERLASSVLAPDGSAPLAPTISSGQPSDTTPLLSPGRKTAREAVDDYFGARIVNENTRAAYLHDAREFARWAAEQGLALDQARTLHVAAFRDQLRARGNAAATVKRKISALRKLFSYLVETGALAHNPAREVSTEPIRRLTGKTPALEPDQMRVLLASFDPGRLIDLRDRALIGVMAYTFARVSAVRGLRAEDYLDLGRSCVLRLHEKGGVEREIPVHPRLVEYLDAWLAASRLTGAESLFPAFQRTGTVMTRRPVTRVEVFAMVKRRLSRAGLPTVFCNHSFRATGITQYLEGGGRLETAQQLANHADSRTTKLYDRRASRIELEEITRIRY